MCVRMTEELSWVKGHGVHSVCKCVCVCVSCLKLSTAAALTVLLCAALILSTRTPSYSSSLCRALARSWDSQQEKDNTRHTTLGLVACPHRATAQMQSIHTLLHHLRCMWAHNGTPVPFANQCKPLGRTRCANIRVQSQDRTMHMPHG